MISLKHLRNVVVVLFAVGLGIVVPQAAHVVESLTLLIVTFLMYTSLRTPTNPLSDATRFVLPVLVVLTITYVAIPVVGMSWARYMLSGESLVGIAVVLSVPATAGSAIVWTRSSQGNDELSGLTSASTIVLAPFVTPVVLGRTLDQPVTLPMARIELELFFIIVASIVLLLVLPNGWVGDRTIDVGSETSIVLLIYAGVGTAGLSQTNPFMLFEVGLTVVAVSTVGLAAAFAATAALDLERADLLALFFSGTLKNLGVAMLIVISFSSDEILLTVIVFYVCQQLLSAVIVDGLSITPFATTH